MPIASAATTVLLALVLLGSSAAKLTRAKAIVEGMTAAGVPLGMLPFLAACEIAGALGLLAGLVYGPLGVAAAGGVVLYFVGAVGAHLRVRDFKGLPPALALLLFAAAVLTLRVLSL
ncbi:DoxX family protein [Marinitenerispora sediminis]|uniref:DoxX family protein n=1 Tax=Marinitenerispora sediminis TaxID=1931232 RepID=A0A368SZ21_9ACTN|nr:DoxX family protein [Marinitenerispora sediminis]RCV48508.1 DoxX family protein [Marinitenerispora sediminis]RCV50373.1 DoxX family protein [Marinitenerispora sediminis]RCV57423.1 DoxX family protein [Marinitenerispora sediminis]